VQSPAKPVEPPKEASPKTESVKPKEAETKKASDEPAEQSPKPVTPQTKKIDFEITNPDDIDIDDKGQLGLF
jgi:topoisomerase-4 subunit A